MGSNFITNYLLLRKRVTFFLILLTSFFSSSGMDRQLVKSPSLSPFLLCCYGVKPLRYTPCELQKQILLQLFCEPLYTVVGIYEDKAANFALASFTHDEASLVVGTDRGPKSFSTTNSSFVDTPFLYEHGSMNALTYLHTEEPTLIAATNSNHLHLYPMEKETGKFKGTVSSIPFELQEKNPVYYMAPTPKGDVLFSTSKGTIFRLCSPNHVVEKLLAHPEGEYIVTACFGSDGDTFACAHFFGRIDLIKLSSQEIKETIECKGRGMLTPEVIKGLCFSSDMSHLYICYEKGIASFDLKEKRFVEFEGTKESVAVEVGPSGKHLLIQDKVNTFKLVDTTKKRCCMEFTFKSPLEGFCQGTLSSSEQFVAIVSRNAVSIWKIDPLIEYIFSDQAQTEQLLFIKFLIDMKTMDSIKIVCRKIVEDKPFLEKEVDLTIEEVEFFEKHRNDIKGLFCSFDKTLQDFIVERFLK